MKNFETPDIYIYIKHKRKGSLLWLVLNIDLYTKVKGAYSDWYHTDLYTKERGTYSDWYQT